MFKKDLLILVAVGAAAIAVAGGMVIAEANDVPGFRTPAPVSASYEAPAAAEAQQAGQPSVSAQTATLIQQIAAMEEANALSGRALVLYREWLDNQETYTAEALDALAAQVTALTQQSMNAMPLPAIADGENVAFEVAPEVDVTTKPGAYAVLHELHMRQSEAILDMRQHRDRRDKLTVEAKADGDMVVKERMLSAKASKDQAYAAIVQQNDKTLKPDAKGDAEAGGK